MATGSGARRLECELPEEEATVGALLAQLAETEPGLALGLDSALPFVGGSHASAGQPLSDGDEVALVLPVSGGTRGIAESRPPEEHTSRPQPSQEDVMTVEDRQVPTETQSQLRVSTFTDGLLGPEVEMLGPVKDGGQVLVNTAPGCWGPMITPALRGGHEVAQPVAVAGAEVGDAIAIRIKDILATSIATASGNDRWMEGRFVGDPYVAAKCAECAAMYPQTRIEGIGPTAVRCASCGADATPFTFTNGYTIAFDEQKRVGVTVGRERAEKIAADAKRFAALPENSIQNSILTFAPHDLVGLASRVRPFMGQLGTTPSTRIPDSHNAGDFGSFLVGAPHEFALTAEELERHRTDGHMDIDAVRAGAILICPAKVPGGGVYMGDMHAMQGDGEIAGHTCDVSGTATLEV